MQNGLEKGEIRTEKYNSIIQNPSEMKGKLSESRLVAEEKKSFCFSAGMTLSLVDIREYLKLFLLVTVTGRHYWHLVGRIGNFK